MTAYTPTLLLPYAEDTDSPDGPAQQLALATATESAIVADRARLTALEAFQIGVAGSSYVPIITQGVTVTKTVEYARYKALGRQLVWEIALAITSGGTAGSAVSISLPLAPLGFRLLGVASIYDASAGPLYYTGALWWQSATIGEIRLSGFGGAAGTATGGFTAALAAGDIVTAKAVYEY